MDDRDGGTLGPTRSRGGAVAVWVWIPAVFVIAIVVWLVVRALS